MRNLLKIGLLKVISYMFVYKVFLVLEIVWLAIRIRTRPIAKTKKEALALEANLRKEYEDIRARNKNAVSFSTLTSYYLKTCKIDRLRVAIILFIDLLLSVFRSMRCCL